MGLKESRWKNERQTGAQTQQRKRERDVRVETALNTHRHACTHTNALHHKLITLKDSIKKG